MASLSLFVEFLDTPTGRLRIVTDEMDRLRALDWDDDDERFDRLLRSLGCGQKHPARRPSASEARRALEAYFDADLSAIDGLAVAATGTEFQRQVWTALREIPAGATASYGEIAARIGQKNASRAVGMANNRNPIAIVVPCHRVIGADGSLTGYGGGMERKIWLLRHEGAII